MSNPEVQSQPWSLAPLSPFGALATAAQPGTLLSEVAPEVLRGWVAKHRVVVLRGFALLVGDAFPSFCRQLGPLLEWSFGVVNHLQVDSNAKNYLYTEREVPFHWDGAFVGRIPHYIFFACDDAPPTGSGGETLFCDTTKMLERATPATLHRWESVRITYTTEKVVHYGGTFSSPLLANHPVSGDQVMRFAEPVNDLNPVALQVEGITDPAAFLADMRERLRERAVCYAHDWQAGDMLIADNHALLHGRNAFSHPLQRQIRRVNIC